MHCNIEVQFNPESQAILEKVTENLKTMNQLLAENKELLRKAIQDSIEVVEQNKVDI